HFRIYESDRIDIKIDCPLNPPPTAFLHTAPVLKRLGYKVVCWYSCNGLIPISNLNRIQIYRNDITVGIELRHFNPVPNSYNVIRRNLYTRHKSKESIFKDQ